MILGKVAPGRGLSMLKEFWLAACMPKAMRWGLADPPKADLCPRGFDGSAAPAVSRVATTWTDTSLDRTLAGRVDWSCTAHSQNR